MAYTTQHHSSRDDASHSRSPYHKPHTSLGATGHWVKTAGILAPLVIGEFIKDPEKKWRAVRIAAVATTLVSEALWTHKISQERQAARNAAACRDQPSL